MHNVKKCNIVFILCNPYFYYILVSLTYGRIGIPEKPHIRVLVMLLALIPVGLKINHSTYVVLTIVLC